MATRRMGGVRLWAAALAAAALATGSWALAQDSGNGAGNGPGNGAEATAPATQQSQSHGDRGFDGRGSDDRGSDDRRFEGRRFERGGPQRFRHERHHWRRDRHHWHGRAGREGRFARAGMRRGAQPAAMRLDAPMLGAFRQLNLSDSQRQSVRTILMNARNSARQERGNQAPGNQPRAAANRQDLAALVNPGDPNHARAVQAAKDRAADRIQRATQTQQALYDVLTPAQKTQLTQIFARRLARLQQQRVQPPGSPG